MWLCYFSSHHPNVIDMVHNLAIRDGMPTNFKNTNKTEVTFYITSWTARVEYTPQSQEAIDDKADTDYDHKPEAEEEDMDKDYNEVDPNKVEGINEVEVNLSDIGSNIAEQEKEDNADNPAGDPQLPHDSTEEPSE